MRLGPITSLVVTASILVPLAAFSQETPPKVEGSVGSKVEGLIEPTILATMAARSLADEIAARVEASCCCSSVAVTTSLDVGTRIAQANAVREQQGVMQADLERVKAKLKGFQLVPFNCPRPAGAPSDAARLAEGDGARALAESATEAVDGEKTPSSVAAWTAKATEVAGALGAAAAVLQAAIPETVIAPVPVTVDDSGFLAMVIGAIDDGTTVADVALHPGDTSTSPFVKGLTKAIQTRAEIGEEMDRVTGLLAARERAIEACADEGAKKAGKADLDKMQKSWAEVTGAWAGHQAGWGTYVAMLTKPEEKGAFLGQILVAERFDAASCILRVDVATQGGAVRTKKWVFAPAMYSYSGGLVASYELVRSRGACTGACASAGTVLSADMIWAHQPYQKAPRLRRRVARTQPWVDDSVSRRPREGRPASGGDAPPRLGGAS